MTMQDNIDIIGRNIRRNMFQAKSQPPSLKIDDQRPIGVPVAIPAHDGERRSYRFQIIRNCRLAHVAQMPDLVRVAHKIENFLRQLVMRVRDNKNPKHQSLRKA